MKVKNEKGMAGIDLVTGLVIFIIGSTVAIIIYIQIYKYVCEIKIHEIIIAYVTEICEEIDLQEYDTNVDNIIQSVNIPSQYTVTEETKKFSEQMKENEGKDVEDIVKKITLTIKYNFLGNDRTFSIEKIKIKEQV